MPLETPLMKTAWILTVGATFAALSLIVGLLLFGQ